MKKFYLFILACAISACCFAQDPYSYEVVRDTTININGTNAYFQCPPDGRGGYMPYYLLDIYQDNTEEFFISIAFAPHADGSFDGSYTVSANANSVAPGQVLASSGVHDGGIWPTYVCRYLSEGVWDAYHAFFISSGSMNVKYLDEDQFEMEINGTFTTIYGSTINISFSGNVPSGMHTDVNNIEAERLDVTVSDHILHYFGDEAYKIFDINGSLIYYGSANEVELPVDGLYIICTESGKTAKIAVK